MTTTVDFSSLLNDLEAESSLRENIRDQTKELEKANRALSSTLNRVHSTPSSQVYDVVLSTAPAFAQCRESIASIVKLVPAHEYWKWYETWSWQLKNAVYTATLCYFLGTGKLLSKERAAQILDIRPEYTDRLMLSTEEYLHSLVSMINELSRLAVNSVTLGDFSTPLRLSTFVKDLHAGFQLLNLKNDSLRKRFDGIKYDIKKIEEVVYDISLRGLLKNATESAQQGIGAGVSPEAEQELLRRLSGRE